MQQSAAAGRQQASVGLAVHVAESKQPAEQAALTLIKWCKRAIKWCKRAVVIVLVAASLKCSFFAGSAFDKQGWASDADGDTGVRHAMGERLAQNQALVGMTRSEVLGKLGKPITHQEFLDWDLVYDLGPARGFLAMGRDFLVVKLTAGGVVERCRIMTDG